MMKWEYGESDPNRDFKAKAAPATVSGEQLSKRH
jgi:hypothetical protein